MSKPDNHVDELGAILTKAFNDFYDYITEKDIIKAAHEYSEKTVYKTAKQQIEGFYRNKILEERNKYLDWWKADILNNFTPKCSSCGIKSRKVVGQTTRGEHAQEQNHLPRNWGYYCQGCYDEGSELEREAMYG